MDFFLFAIIGLIFIMAVIFSSNKNPKSKTSINIVNQNKIYAYLDEHNLTNLNKFVARDYSGALVYSENDEMVTIISPKLKKDNGEYEFNYITLPSSKIIEAEIIIDNQTIHKTVRGQQILNTAVGGALFGSVGALIGGLTADKLKQEKIKSIDLKILTEDVNSPVHKLNFLKNIDPNSGEVIKDGYMKDSSEVRAALGNIEKWHGIMEIIIRQQNKSANV
ncbi:hypothetical protein EVU96_09390 [Bacillus infantis]|uniref:hypothetical protein n=1 Tax=Bacillus infantis TaxID=324767 RepID=UPI00101C962D|nr:hypothetical protein [Bacillus infantis]RYI30619.1 hypothetical protein EVU96_09390 [Bacillus infantis]